MVLAGLCHKAGSKTTCASPSFTPIFVEVYDTVKMPARAQEVLPAQFPLQPTAMFLSVALSGVAWLLVVLSALGMHCTKKLAFLTRKQPKIRKLALVQCCRSGCGRWSDSGARRATWSGSEGLQQAQGGLGCTRKRLRA